MKHKHADLIKQWVEDTTQVVEYSRIKNKWKKVDGTPLWNPDFEYRIRHKHQDLIDQKEARPELIVEWRPDVDIPWVVTPSPEWLEECEYRLVEPEPAKKKVKMWQWVIGQEGYIGLSNSFYKTAEEASFKTASKVIQRADWTEIEVEE